jgi:hypothetical protein
MAHDFEVDLGIDPTSSVQLPQNASASSPAQPVVSSDLPTVDQQTYVEPIEAITHDQGASDTAQASSPSTLQTEQGH